MLGSGGVRLNTGTHLKPQPRQPGWGFLVKRDSEVVDHQAKIDRWRKEAAKCGKLGKTAPDIAKRDILDERIDEIHGIALSPLHQS
ncbi:hypothetical protein CVM73_18900 [Bradyrhizobium forestalis]|uniref:Uncharacterized protein n=1 Tax=Bradyrhizobium forestalis TaxID=1419263 RepID=A0A2M8R7M7_9BRAD|nr:hypothetical protein CVM73_18900 [Bradyrhizobium forestalis]